MKITGFTRLFALLLCAAMLCSCAQGRESNSAASSQETSAVPTQIPEVANSGSDPYDPSPDVQTYLPEDTPLSAEQYFSIPENENKFIQYLIFLVDYAFEPCDVQDLSSDQMIDAVVWMCPSELENEESDAFSIIDEQDINAWANRLFGKKINLNDLAPFDHTICDDIQDFVLYCEYEDHIENHYLFLAYDADNHVVYSRNGDDCFAIRGYGMDRGSLQISTDGSRIIAITPILKIEDREVYEFYHTLRYEFQLRETSDGTPYYSFISATLVNNDVS